MFDDANLPADIMAWILSQFDTVDSDTAGCIIVESRQQINQTCFGSTDSPIEQQGNCLQACIATVLQIPLEEAFDCRFHEDNGGWFDDFNEWLEQYNLGCIYLEHTKEKPLTCSEIKGIFIMECMSKTLYQGDRHVVVMRGGDLLHDPNPNAREQGECQGIYLFVPLEPYKLVN